MWIVTPRGFYSVVQKGSTDPNVLTVRTRNRDDLDRLLELIDRDVKPSKFTGTDYPWRIRLTRREWDRAVATMNSEIDYSNFKDEVARVQGPERARIYGRLWHVLLDLEGEDEQYPWWERYGSPGPEINWPEDDVVPMPIGRSLLHPKGGERDES